MLVITDNTTTADSVH